MPNIIEIKDFAAPPLDIYARLSEAALLHYYEPNGGIFIAESPLVIERALAAGCIPISALAERRQLQGQSLAILERCGDIPIYTADFEVLTQLTGFQLTRGMLCAMRRPRLSAPAAICTGARRIAVLENVVNPTNIGAIFRSAAAMHIDAVLLTAGCSDPLYRRAIRVSMGTVFQIPWTFFTPETAWLQLLHDLGFQAAAMALDDNAVSIADPRLKTIDKLAIVLGTEGEGLSSQTIAACEHTVKIPMSHGVDSLNVAAASAVAFWELTKG